MKQKAGRSPAVPFSVVTGMTFSASPERTWEGLVFYEQIARRPPLYLRLLLPVPVRVEGRKSAVGDETRCVYERGHLLKRVTRVVPLRQCRFEVVEQDLVIAGGIRLSGGGYTLTERPDGSTRVELETRYVSPLRPRWLSRPIEATVCHVFHRHILAAMRRAAEPPAVSPAPAPGRFVPERLTPGSTPQRPGGQPMASDGFIAIVDPRGRRRPQQPVR